MSGTILEEKGIFTRPPIIPMPEKAEMVQKQSFLAGWLGERRPLSVIEVMNIYSNLQRNSLGQTILIGFSQVATSKTVRDYMLRGIDIGKKHVEVFGGVLKQEDLPASVPADTAVTQSTISPFSEKLMMFHTAALIAGSISF
jgi:hypothetical protein